MVCFEVTFEGVKWSDVETLMAVGIWFQIWGAAEEKARRPKSVYVLGTCRRDWLEERRERLGWWYSFLLLLIRSFYLYSVCVLRIWTRVIWYNWNNLPLGRTDLRWLGVAVVGESKSLPYLSDDKSLCDSLAIGQTHHHHIVLYTLYTLRYIKQ